MPKIPTFTIEYNHTGRCGCKDAGKININIDVLAVPTNSSETTSSFGLPVFICEDRRKRKTGSQLVNKKILAAGNVQFKKGGGLGKTTITLVCDKNCKLEGNFKTSDASKKIKIFAYISWYTTVYKIKLAGGSSGKKGSNPFDAPTGGWKFPVVVKEKKEEFKFTDSATITCSPSRLISMREGGSPIESAEMISFEPEDESVEVALSKLNINLKPKIRRKPISTRSRVRLKG